MNISLFKRAWRDTIHDLGFNLGTFWRSLAVPSVFVFLLFIWYDGNKAVGEAIEVGLYVVAFIVTAIVPTFLWNLWLAPYRLMEESIGNAIAGDRIIMEEIPTLCIEDWEKVEVLHLHQAACLWVNVVPHYPIRDQRARAALAQLKGAIKTGKLFCEENRYSLLVHALAASKIPWVKDNEAVTRNELAKYARLLAQPIPDFLKSVELPNCHNEDESIANIT